MSEPVIEDGAMKIDGKWWKSEGGVKIHPTVYFQSYVSVKRGLWKDTYTEIGEGTYICSFVNIGHNAKIGKECFIAPGAILVGNVELGDHVYVGARAVITQDRKIGSWVKIHAGETVNFNVQDNTYVDVGGVLRQNKSSPFVNADLMKGYRKVLSQ